LSDEDTKAPDFLQIKGYKYRAKMLLAAAALLTIMLIIIISLFRSITSSTREKNRETDSDNISSTTQAVDSNTDSKNEILDTDTISNTTGADSKENTSSNISLKQEEKFDADGKLIIDTDTLGGKKAIALTFDDGPGEYTSYLIDELDKRDVRATFFMVGSCVNQYSEVLPKMVNGGHQLGNHTFNHTDITSVSNKEMNNQITKTDEAIFNACGQYPTAFRPPYGACNDNTNMVITDKIITLWSVDTFDWKLNSGKEVKNAIVSQCKDGDIILMHDIHKTTVDGVILAIDELQKQGYVFVTVEELLSRYGYEITMKEPHSSQYAVYETNSPYANKYLKEINSQKAEKASSTAADSFYTDSSRKSDDTEKDTASRENDDSIKIVREDTDTERKIY